MFANDPGSIYRCDFCGCKREWNELARDENDKVWSDEYNTLCRDEDGDLSGKYYKRYCCQDCYESNSDAKIEIDGGIFDD